jgi:hypothetical protein
VKGATVVIKVFIVTGLFVAGASLLTPKVTMAAAVDSYVKDGQRFTCIMQDTLKYCGNWNVAGPAPT